MALSWYRLLYLVIILLLVYLASLARRPTHALFIYLFKFHVIIRKNYTAAWATEAVIVLWFELQVISVVWRAHTKLDIRCIEIGEWYFRGESSIGYYLHHDGLIIQLGAQSEQYPVWRKILQNLSEIGSWCRHKVEMMNQVSANLRARTVQTGLEGMPGMVH